MTASATTTTTTTSPSDAAATMSPNAALQTLNSVTLSSSSHSSTFSDSHIIIRGYKGTLPLFFESEIRVDNLLGTGSFCMAWTIKKVQLREQNDDNDNNSLPNPDARRRLAARVNAAVSKRDPTLAIHGRSAKAAVDPTAVPRCVMKRLRTDIYAHFDDMSRAAEDLKAELDILLRVGTGEHPNIIDLYAIGMAEREKDDDDDDNNNDDDDNDDKGISFQPTFLILSRIRSTLEQLLVRWRDQRGFGVFDALNKAGTQQLWLERMILLSRLADAIQYLHGKRIIFRDIKPENVGTDDNGVVKLFDFGLAKQIKQQEDDQQGDLYQLTGNTGTPRYMPPEVADCQPYGYSVDVYSLAILMHQVLSLKTPFAQIPPGEYGLQVYVNHVRPPLDNAWPLRLREMIEQMWQANPKERPTAETVADTLSEMLRGSDAELFPKIGWFR